jgi:ATP-binding cassette subfamily B protein
VDALINFETVKYFGTEEKELKRYEAEVIEYNKAAMWSRSSLGLLSAGQAGTVASINDEIALACACDFSQGSLHSVRQFS